MKSSYRCPSCKRMVDFVDSEICPNCNHELTFLEKVLTFYKKILLIVLILVGVGFAVYLLLQNIRDGGSLNR